MTTFVEQSHPEAPRPQRKEAPLYRRGPMMLTPELAEHFRTECQYPRQRKMSGANVGRISYIIRRNEWIPYAPIAVAILPDGREWLINGNHTAEAVRRTGAPVPVTLICHDCATEEEAHRYYAAYDVHKPRTPADHRRAMGDDELPLAQHVFSAAGFIISGFGAQYTQESDSRAARSMVANEYAGEAKALADALARGLSRNTKIIKRVPVTALALATLRHQREEAKRFWHDAAHDRGDANTPGRAMIRQLGEMPNINKPFWRKEAEIVTMAWNAFMAGETRMFFQPSKAKHFKLAGTPVDLNAPSADLVVGVRVTNDGLKKTGAVIEGGEK